MTTKVDICEPKVFPASPYEKTSMGDSGLGFNQGSVEGVYNQYSYKGFHRPQVPEIDRGLRRRFNLRGFRGSREYSCAGGSSDSYRCHYDPAPYFDEYKLPSHTYNNYQADAPYMYNTYSLTIPNKNNDSPQSSITSHIMTVASLIIVIILLFLWFF